jgi:hypothetical protein
MKRLLISLCVAMVLPAFAQTQPAKPSSSKKTPAAAPAKSKLVIMTRDELRNCLKTDIALRLENETIREEGKKYETEVQIIKEEQKALSAQSASIESATKALVAEQTELLESRKQFDEPVKPSELKAIEARKIEFNDRVNAQERKRESLNADIQAYKISVQRINAMADQSNAKGRTLVERQEKQESSFAEWRADCANKPYDVADEIAVKKELKQAQ